jgi:hypothetical protein
MRTWEASAAPAILLRRSVILQVLSFRLRALKTKKYASEEHVNQASPSFSCLPTSNIWERRNHNDEKTEDTEDTEDTHVRKTLVMDLSQANPNTRVD